jgi:glycosyltransferase involved in cell wall biosynthesis/predicted metal-dependent phosphoesterase TrpH
MQSDEVRVDLHVHSEHSDRPYSWFLRSGKSAECYTAVKHVYETAIARGMNLVTITDHDNIDAALELAAIAPNTFISEEVSARFPEDGNIMHVIALDLSEAEHVELQRLRGNIYELAQYLHDADIPAFLCHPLSAVNRRLDASHIERCLLMFRNLELRNGTRDAEHETCLSRILAGTGPETLARYAARHPRTPWLNRFGRYAVVGGSDDHGRIGIARAFTSFPGEASAAGLRAALRAYATQPGGQHATQRTLGHNAYGVLTGFLKSGAGIANLATAVSGAGASPTASMKATVVKHVGGFDWHECWQHGHESGYEELLHERLSGMLMDLHRTSLGGLGAALEKVDLVRVTAEIPDILRSVLLGLPYVLSSRYHARDRREAQTISARLGFSPETSEPARVAVFTDSIDHVDGVSLGLRRLAATARAQGLDLRLVGIAKDPAATKVTVDEDGIVRLPTVFRHRLSMYPSMEFGIPLLESVLDWIISERITLVQCSTPGPVGIAGLAAARLCALPVIGQYHTDVPEYATRLSGDPTFGQMVGHVVGWFYRQMDRVLVPSEAVAKCVVRLGVAENQVTRVPRGVDLELFRPRVRDPHAFAEFGLNGDPKVLYVGRISREKGLDALVDGFDTVEPADAKLILVGGGPYREQLAARSPGGRVIFAGEQTGERLAELYASADVFVFPSETETFGNAVVEAQAAGLPVIVANKGAAAENVVPGVTGLVVDATRPEELREALALLLENPQLRERMGRAAHEWARKFDLPAAARGTFRTYERILDGAAE